jgi:TP901 family phage tail tape measure protein
MSNVMTVALQFTAIDMMQGVLSRVKNSVLSLGNASGKVKRDFDDMTNHITSGLKAIAISAYAVNKALPGVRAAGDLEEAMLGVKMNIASSAKSAHELTTMLGQVKGTAISVAAQAPFSAEDVVRIQNSLLKAGMDLKDVMGNSGAAFSATALATLSGAAPEVVGDSLANIGSMFKFRGADYGAFSDWLTRVDDAAATNLPALIQGLRMAGSSADALGISAKDSVTALGALSPLGERAGSAFNNFLMAFATRRKELAAMGLDVFKGGKFIGLAAATDMLQQKFGAIKDDGRRLGLLMKIFGEEGGRAANTFINAEKGFRDIESSAIDALSMAEKLSIWGEGFNASLKKLGGTAKSTLASIFDPLLAPLTQVINLLNAATSKLGEFVEKNKVAATAISGTVGAVAAGAGLYGLIQVARGGAAGAKVLKGLGGIKGLLGDAAGIAKGKAVQAATGVTAVYVTNWPGSMSNPLSPSNPDARKKLEDLFTKPSGVPKSAGMAGKLAGLAQGAGGLVAAGAAGYAIGSIINEGINAAMQTFTGGKNNSFGEWLYDRIHGEPEIKNDMKINIIADFDKRRVTAQTADPRANVSVDLNRGTWDNPLGMR